MLSDSSIVNKQSVGLIKSTFKINFLFCILESLALLEIISMLRKNAICQEYIYIKEIKMK